MKPSLLHVTMSGMLAISSAAMSGEAKEPAKKSDKTADVGECHGVNSCKGQGACAGKGYSCAGNNSCKGQGWLEMTKEECAKKEGKFKSAKK